MMLLHAGEFQFMWGSPTRHAPNFDGARFREGTWRSRVISEAKYSSQDSRDPEELAEVCGTTLPEVSCRKMESPIQDEGIGRYGAAVSKRTQIVAEAGYRRHVFCRAMV